jgi:hypothetical protein
LVVLDGHGCEVVIGSLLVNKGRRKEKQREAEDEARRIVPL